MKTIQSPVWQKAAWASALLLAVSQAACYAAPYYAEEPPQPGPPPGDYDPQQAPPPPQYPQAQPQQQPPQQPGEEDGRVEDFYEPLAQYGTWIDTPEYGRVWQPGQDQVSQDFTPYASDGTWATNDSGDYVFESTRDTSWGWATYHYGRWTERPDYGWVWIPGTQWAPSWVEWRTGGGYVGWAPMGPPGVVVVADRWFFVEDRWFGAPGFYSYRLPPERVYVAWGVAYPITERRYGRWYAGPSSVYLRQRGVSVRTTRVAPPPRGYVRSQATVVVRTAQATRPYQRQGQAQPWRRDANYGRTYQPQQPPQHHQAQQPPQHHQAQPPQHHQAQPPQHHQAQPPPQHHQAHPPTQHTPPPAVTPPPKPRPAPPAHHAPPPKKRK